MSRRRKRLLWSAIGTFGFLLGLLATGVLVVRSDWFREKVRQRIVLEAEKATGGRVALGSFGFDWKQLRAEVRRFAIHGREPEGQPPLFQAASIQVGLKIASALRRDVDIASLIVIRPEVCIEVYPDGTNNLPSPKVPRRSDNFMEPVLKLAVRRFELRDGTLQYLSRRIPLDVRGNNLRADFVYEAVGPRYRGHVSARQLQIDSSKTLRVAFDTDVSLVMREDRIEIPNARMATVQSSVDISGAVENLAAPRANFGVQAQLSLAELGGPLRIPLERRGFVEISGQTTLGGQDHFGLKATVSARDLAIEQPHARLSGMRLTSAVTMSRELIRLEELRVTALDGAFAGQATIERFRDFRVEGEVQNFSLLRLMPAVGAREVAWNGAVSGPLRLEGQFPGAPSPGIRGSGQLTISPKPGGLPLQGFLDLAFDQRAGTLQFGLSHLATPGTLVNFSGAMSKGLRVRLFSRDLSDFLPAIGLGTDQPPARLPVELRRGVLKFDGAVSGTWTDPRVTGRASIGPFAFQGRVIDQLSAELDLTRGQLRLENAVLEQDQSRLEGRAKFSLEMWRVIDSSAIEGTVSVRGVSLRRALLEAGTDLPLDGAVSGSLDLKGTTGDPRVLARLSVQRPTAYGETLDRALVELFCTRKTLELRRGRLEAGSGVLELTGSYEAAGENWESGQAQFEITGTRFTLIQWDSVRRFRAGLDGELGWSAKGVMQVRGGRPQLASLHGEASLTELALEGRTLGSLHLTADTRGRVMTARTQARLRDARISGSAEWSLEGDSFGLGQIQFTNLTFRALQDVGLLGGPDRNLYMEASFDGEVGFSGPVLRPADWNGMAKVTSFELSPDTAAANQLTLRNAIPLLFRVDAKGISIQSARFVSNGTDLEVSGDLSFRARNPWDLSLKGSMNLGVLRAFRPDLVTAGKSTVDAVVRGSLTQPQVSGRMELADASFHLRDLPNGIEKVNGVIVFDRSRATIEKLTSQTGGGDLDLNGFIGFGGEELVYRLQASAERVRVRYPEGVSTSLNANLSLTGTFTRSLLSGTVTVLRAGFNPSTDLGSLLSQPVKPPAPVTTNAFLRGMQFDIRVDTSANAEFLTSLTRDIQLEANLRLRGGPVNPAVLGRVSINQGEIQFFGNKYNIVRGEISFFNPVKVDPVVAMDLETRVRGITVTINFSGPINKLNFSYRSDPPLQSQEIIALLTVGRAPGSAGGLAGSPSTQGQSFLQSGGNTLLGQAISAPVSSRLQRFFGVSRLKIDPQLTGVDNTPQARLTLEQQISRNITLTYITNLTRTQQQIVRVEWDVSRDWSVLAVRDSNGVFGVDFLYRRRFE